MSEPSRHTCDHDDHPGAAPHGAGAGHVHKEHRGHAHAHAAHGHSHAHDGHGHNHDWKAQPRTALTFALGVTLAFALVEVAVGRYSGSLALVADAGHMLSDAGALGLALIAQYWAARPRSEGATYGYRRAEVLAAFVNGIALALVSVFILKEAVVRWITPVPIETTSALICAALGLGVNGLVAWVLHRMGGDNVNIKAVFAHVLSDAIGSIAAIASALSALFFGIYRADPVLSVVIAGLVAIGGWRIIKHTTHVLLESTPPGVKVASLEAAILSCQGVAGCHDLHVWRISEGFDAVTVHVTLASDAHGVEVSRRVSHKISTDFGIRHVTVQPEAPAAAEIVPLRLSRDGAPHRDIGR